MTAAAAFCFRFPETSASTMARMTGNEKVVCSYLRHVKYSTGVESVKFISLQDVNVTLSGLRHEVSRS